MAAGATVYDANANDTGAAADAGISYTLTAGADMALFNINSITGALSFKAATTYASANDANGDHTYNVAITATDIAGNSNVRGVAITLAPLASNSTIAVYTKDASGNLVSAGNLIAPATVDGGSTYYFWDYSGSSVVDGSTDLLTHTLLDSIFKYDSNGVLNTATNTPTTDVYRYGTLYTSDGQALQVALPTYGVPLINGSGSTGTKAGTAVSGTSANSTYSDLLALWDAYNGTGTSTGNGTGTNGVPAAWLGSNSAANFWSATLGSTGHLIVSSAGVVTDTTDTSTAVVALQVTAPDVIAPTTGTKLYSVAFSVDTGVVGDLITKTAAQTISGALSAPTVIGETVYVSLNNGSTWTAASNTLGTSTWTLANQSLVAGANTLQVEVRDRAGNIGPIYSQSYTYDTTAPSTVLATVTAFSNDTGVSGDFITSVAGQTISGTLSAASTAGQTVYVSLDGGSTWSAASNTVGSTTWSLAGQTLTAGTHTVMAKLSSLAGTDSSTVTTLSYTYDNATPVFSGPNTAMVVDAGSGVATSTTVYTASATDPEGTALTYSLAGIGPDNALFNIDASTGVVTFKATASHATPNDAGADHVYNITVRATDVAGNSKDQLVAVTLAPYSIAIASTAGGTALGNLIAPVMVNNGNIYYFWDRNGGGSADIADSIALNTVASYFNRNASGVASSPTALNNIYRYGIFYDTTGSANLRVAMPTYGGPVTAAGNVTWVGSGSVSYLGTALGSSTASNGSNASNPLYTDLLAIWDAYNGTGTGTGDAGRPSNWLSSPYALWSATPGATTGYINTLGYGSAYDQLTGNTYYFALQVFPTDTTAPAIGMTSVLDNVGSVTGLLSSGASIDTPTLALSGLTEAAASVNVYNGSTLLGAASVASTGTWTYTARMAGDAVYHLSATASDAAGNAGTSSSFTLTVDTTAPVFSSAALALATNVAANGSVTGGTAVYDANASNAGGAADVGITYSLSGAGPDNAKFSIDSVTGIVTIKANASYDYPTDFGADHVYDITVRATNAVGVSSTQAVRLVLAPTSITLYSDAAHTTLLGTLNYPVLVDGNTAPYYVLSAVMSGDQLDAIFNHDINGVINSSVANADGNYGTTDVYRYGTLYTAGGAAMQLALPTYGGPAPAASGSYLAGTAVGNASNATLGSVASNPTYNDWAAIWDAYNGTGFVGVQNVSGVPAGWVSNYYQTATPGSTGHILFYDLLPSVGSAGFGVSFGDTSAHYVALQLIAPDTSAPGVSIDSVIDNTGAITGALASGATTDATTLALTGSTEPGATVTVYDGSTLLGSASVAANGTWTYSATLGSGSTHQFNAHASDAAGNSATGSNFAVTVDTVAPVFSSVAREMKVGSVAAGATVYDANASKNGGTNDAGISYSLSGGADAALFSINSSTGVVTINLAASYAIPSDYGADNIYDFTVRASTAAGVTTDKAVQLVLAASSIAVYSNAAHTASVGNLINPVMVDGGNLYYYWDMSGDGTSAGVDYKALSNQTVFFNHNLNGVTSGSDNTAITEVYRYGTVYLASGAALQVALPTYGGPMVAGSAVRTTYANTAVSGNAVNPTYDGLLAVLVAYNGTPTGWATNLYVTASPVNLGTSYYFADPVFGSSPWQVNSVWFATDAYTALEVFPTDTTAPLVAITSALDNVGAITGALPSGAITDDSTLVLSGTSEAGAAVKLYNGSTLLGAASVSGDGSWTFNAGVANGGVYHFNATATDAAGNVGSSSNFNLTGATLAPTFSSLGTATLATLNVAAGATVYDANASKGGGAADVGVLYSLAGAGPDNGLFSIDSVTGIVTIKAAASYAAPNDFGADHVYDITVRASTAAGVVTDKNVAIGIAAPTTVAIWFDAAHTQAAGNLILPVSVDGTKYYYWDRSGDGSSANYGSLNSGVDYISHSTLNSIFLYDANGVRNSGSGTDDVYRYATLYTSSGAMQVALPTANGGRAYPNGISGTGIYQNGTAYVDTTGNGSTSPTYKGLLAIWDAFNGTGTGSGPTMNGTPPNWQYDLYWSATPSVLGHAGLSLNTGSVIDGIDAVHYFYLALQLVAPNPTGLDTSAPGITINSVVDNTGPVTGALVSGASTDATTLVLSGSTEANATVAIYNDGAATALGTVTADANGLWTYTATGLQDATTYQFNVTATDHATTPNTSAHSNSFTVTVDTAAPAFGSATTATLAYAVAAGATVYDANASEHNAAADLGMTYSLAGIGPDNALFSIDSGTGIVRATAAINYTTANDFGADHVYDITVRATNAAGVSTTQAVAITVSGSIIAVYTDAAHTQPVGNLIAEHTVDGANYYYWDRSGDGTTANSGNLNSSVDFMTHGELNSIFKYDINGVSNGGSGTTDVYRYATFYAGDGSVMRVALPTANVPTPNGGPAYPNGIGQYQGGTAYSDPTGTGSTSPTYKGLLAIWDANNGTGTGSGPTVNGTPSGWLPASYWSSTPSALGHATVLLDRGFVYDSLDVNSTWAALQLVTPTVTVTTPTDTTSPPVVINSITGYTGAVAETLVSGGLSHDTTSLVLSGSTEIGASVNVYDGSAGTTLLGAASVASDGTWSYTVSTGLTDGSVHNFNATATDTHSNTSAHSSNFLVTIDTVAPVFTSAATATVNDSANATVAAGVTVYDANATHNGGATDAGVIYSLSGGADVGLFQIDSSSGMVSFKNVEAFATPHDSNADHVYNFNVHAADAAGNAPTDQAVAITVAAQSTIAVYFDAAHTSSAGNLIAPHAVDGASYYYWDRSGDGTLAGNATTPAGSLNSGSDLLTHTDLDSVFKYDVNGVSNGGSGTTDVYRYATLYTADGTALQVALPTANGGLAYPNGINLYQNGTAYTDSTDKNISSPTYKGLLAIWDANNGSSITTGTPLGGTPSSWSADHYWSATTWASGHVLVGLNNGHVDDTMDGNRYYVALQVL